MRAQGSGTVVNLASIAGLNGFPPVGYHSASKFAVAGSRRPSRRRCGRSASASCWSNPCGFRTDWAPARVTAHPVAAYATLPPLRR